MQSMLKKDFWYDLPKELIAQEPADPRDSARLMVLSQKDGSIQHRIFRDLPEYLEPGDLLVVNNSKVLPARIVGVKQPTGAVCELLLLRQVKGDQWECLAKPGKRMQPGTKVSFGDGTLTAVVDETLEDGNKFVTFYYDTETLYEKLDEFGKMPLPPYITKQLEDQSQYQTVYAKELGVTQQMLYRALVVSNLVTIHLKTGIGSLSAYCGATAAGCGAGAGVTYLYGGQYLEIAHTIVNAIAIDSGMICDGAKASCAAKIASAVEAGLLGMQMQMHESQFYGGDGIVVKGVENTIRNIGTLASEGMRETDRTIIRMMIQEH